MRFGAQDAAIARGNPLRVTHIASGDLWAGAEVQCFQLIRSLAESGDVLPRAVILNHGELAERIRSIGIEMTVIPENQHSPPALFYEVVRNLRTNGADVVHTHRTKENIIGAFAARAAGIGTSVRTAHGAPEHRHRGLEPAKRAIAALDTFVGRRLQQRVIAVSEDLATRLKSQFGAARVSTIPNGIDVERTLAEANALETLTRHPGILRIGLIGRLVPVKRVDLFLSIAAALHAAFGATVEFYVIGDGPDAALLREVEARGELPLHALGFRRDALALMRCLDLMLVTSDHEGTPMVVLEALALRVLVAARRVGGLPALLGDGKHGLLISSQDPSSWVDALRPFLLEAAQRRALADRGFEAVTSQWSAGANARSYVELYRACLQRR